MKQLINKMVVSMLFTDITTPAVKKDIREQILVSCHDNWHCFDVKMAQHRSRDIDFQDYLIKKVAGGEAKYAEGTVLTPVDPADGSGDRSAEVGAHKGGGALAAALIGGIFLVFLLILAFIYCRHRGKKDHKSGSHLSKKTLSKKSKSVATKKTHKSSRRKLAAKSGARQKGSKITGHAVGKLRKRSKSKKSNKSGASKASKGSKATRKSKRSSKSTTKK